MEHIVRGGCLVACPHSHYSWLTCLINVHKVVTQLLALGDEIHVIDAELVVVGAGVNIVEVAAFELLAVVIDLGFEGLSFGEIDGSVFALRYDIEHLVHRLIIEVEHGEEVLVLLGGVWLSQSQRLNALVQDISTFTT